MLEGFRILLHGGLVRRVSQSLFRVRGWNDKRWVSVEWKRRAWHCKCRQGLRYVSNCGHATAVMLLLRLPSLVLINHNPEQYACPRCGAELEEAELSGVQRNKSGLVQRYQCNGCGYRFNDRNSFKGIKSDPSLIVLSVDLYLRGLSAREVASHLSMAYSCRVSHTTVYRWVIRVCKLLRAVEKVILSSVKLGGKWHGDEIVTKVNGTLAYTWTIIDARSRYLLAASLQSRRDTATFRKVLSEVVSHVGSPREFVTDGLTSYREGLPLVDPLIRHTSRRRFIDEGNNNLIERLNKSVRRRTKVAEKFMDQAKGNDILNGYRMHYNLVRPHESLGYRTPAEAGGFRFKSSNKLLELITLSRPTAKSSRGRKGT